MKNKYRTHNCSELSEKDINKTITLSGWLHRKRDHGNLLFIDLRDHFGITQCVIENDNQHFSTLEKLKPESVLKVIGKVVKGQRIVSSNTPGHAMAMSAPADYGYAIIGRALESKDTEEAGVIEVVVGAK